MKLFKSTQLKVLTTTLILVGSASVLLPSEAEARHGRRGRRSSLSFGFGVPYYSSFYSPHYLGTPYGFAERGRSGGLNPAVARAIGVGGLDLNIKPRKAEVFVDGDYAGTVADFDGYPSFLWMKEGTHVVTIYKGGFKTFEESFAIKAGIVLPVKLQLSPGQSEAPGAENQPAHFAPSALDLAFSVAAR